MAPGRPCSNCSFDPAQQQIPTVEELREVYLPHYEALRPQFNALHRELQHFADRRAHHGRSLKMSRLICLLVGLIGAAQLVARLLESFTLESAVTPSVIILFAFAMTCWVRRAAPIPPNGSCGPSHCFRPRSSCTISRPGRRSPLRSAIRMCSVKSSPRRKGRRRPSAASGRRPWNRPSATQAAGRCVRWSGRP